MGGLAYTILPLKVKSSIQAKLNRKDKKPSRPMIEFLAGGSGRSFVWSPGDKTITYEANLESGATETRTIDVTTKKVLERKLDTRIGRGELDDGIDVVKLQEEVDKGDQRWRNYIGCYEYGCESVKGENYLPPKPWRLDPFRVLQNVGKFYGFTSEDLMYKNSKSVFSESGETTYRISKVKHKTDYYLVTISQPIAGYDKIWIVSEIDLKGNVCNPPLVGMRFRTEWTANKVLEEEDGKLKPIASPQQFSEKNYKSYCIDWYDFGTLPVDIIAKLPKTDILKNLNANEIENWSLYSDDKNLGIQFKHPRKRDWDNFTERKFGDYKLYFKNLNIYVNTVDRSG